MRDFWRGQARVGDFAYRFTGSADLYERDGRRPFASINFITAHDGFTLDDLVSYNGKHNEANLEDNRDGTDDNRSWNCGAEGPTDDPGVNELRAPPAAELPRHAVPLAGRADAARAATRRGRTQGGNNNAYCQDNEISWVALGPRRGRASAARRSRKRLIELRREHPVFRRDDVPRRRARASAALPDSWWFRPDGRKMTRRELGAARGGRGSACSSTATSCATARRSGEPLRRRLVPDPLQRRTTSRVEFTLPPRRFGRAGQLELSTAEPDAAPTQRPRARRRSTRRVAVAARAAARCRDACRSRDLPAPARADARRSTTRAGSCRTCASSASATSTSRRCCRRGAARRTATTSSTRRVSATSSAARPSCARSARRRGLGWASCSTSSRTTWRRDDENLFWRDPELRARFFDLDPATGRHRRFFDVDELAGRARRGPGGVRDDCTRYVLELVARRARRRPARSTTPTGSPIRAATSSGSRPRASSASGSRRSSSRASRCATGRSRARPGYEFLNDVQALFVDPAGEAALDRARRASGRFDEVADRGQARAGRDDVPARGRAAAAAARRARPRARARVAARLPHLRRAVERPRRRTPTARALAALPDDLRRVLLLEERGHDEFVTRFQQTTGAGHGEGRRGHGLLPLRPPARAERGRRRSRAASALAVEAVPSRNARARRRASRARCSPATTHDTKRSADVRARIGALAGMAERWADAVERWHELTATLRDGDAPDRIEELLRLPDARRRLADRARAARAVPREGAARGEAQHELDRPERARGRRRCKRFATGLLTHEPFLADFEPLAARDRRRAASARCARPARAAAHLARRAGHLPRRRAAVLRARRPRQPPAGRLGRAPRRAGLARRAARRLGEAARDPRGCSRCAARRPEAFAGATTSRSRAGEGTCAYRRGEHVVVAVPVRGDEPELEPAARPLAQRARRCRRRARRLPCAAARTALTVDERCCVIGMRLRPTAADGTLRRDPQVQGGDTDGSKGEEDRNAARRRRRRRRVARRRRRPRGCAGDHLRDDRRARVPHRPVRRRRHGRGELASGRGRAAQTALAHRTGAGGAVGRARSRSRRRPPCPLAHRPAAPSRPAGQRSAWDHRPPCPNRRGLTGRSASARDRPAARAAHGVSRLPAAGAADAGAVARGAHPARLLRDRLPGARALRRVALPAHRRPALPHARACAGRR